LDELRRGLQRGQVEGFIGDPIYLSSLAGQRDLKASNLFDMGPLFLGGTRAGLDAGCTPFFSHHGPKHYPCDPITELDGPGFAGIAEFARQWLLISRREPYVFDGKHKLWLCGGGSMGHSNQWAVDIEEGVLRQDFGGRFWDVTVSLATDCRQGVADRKAEEQ